jgi:hypothetical protein
MSERRLPIRPNLDQLKQQAKELLRAVRSSDAGAIADFAKYHPRKISPGTPKLVDAQLVLARAYEAPSWPRLVAACKLIEAIWSDDVGAVRKIIQKDPRLLHEETLIRKSNWGPPMSYAANLGRDRIIEMLHGLGARDLATALNRAALQTQIGTARKLHAMMQSPVLAADALNDPAYTLSADGTALVLELGAPVVDEHGKRLAPVDVVLETDSRKPAAKHAILEMYVQHGLTLPDTPVMALHRGRIDLLEEHLRRDPDLLRRTFRFEEIYPPELGCRDEILATYGTPLAGATLLHMAVDYDEMEIARWLLARGMNVDAKAAVDASGFGGRVAAEFLDESQRPDSNRAIHGIAAAAWRRSKCARLVTKATASGIWRRADARISRCDAAVVGRAIYAQGICEHRGDAFDRRTRWTGLSSVTNCRLSTSRNAALQRLKQQHAQTRQHSPRTPDICSCPVRDGLSCFGYAYSSALQAMARSIQFSRCSPDHSVLAKVRPQPGR